MDSPQTQRHVVIRTLVWVFVFSVAMGYLETAVVVYLREIYYPDGFSFPLVPLDIRIAITEVVREAATVVMLLGLGALVGRNWTERFAYFIFGFAVWDIFYYIFLKWLLDWPESWLTWDILFLIPVMWVGPMVTPVILSVSMIVLSIVIVFSGVRDKTPPLATSVWVQLILGSCIVVLSFTWDYVAYTVPRAGWMGLFSTDILSTTIRSEYVPDTFPWLLFWIGEAFILTGIVWHARHTR